MQHLAAVANAQRRAVLVLGMHRSGTSAVAGALHLLGADAPANMIPAAADNPSGFFESIVVLGVNDWMLTAAGSIWYDCLGFSSEVFEPERRSTAMALINFGLMMEFDKASLLLLKDPRLCLVANLWLPVLEAIGIASTALLVLRHPHEVIASLAARNAYPAPLAAALWLHHMLSAELATRGHPRAAIAYDALLRDWRLCLDRASRQAGMSWPVAFETVADRMQRFLDSGLHHRRAASTATTHIGLDPLPILLTQAHEALCGLIDDPADPRHLRRLDDVRMSFSHWREAHGRSLAAELLHDHPLRSEPPVQIPRDWEDSALRMAKLVGLQTGGV